MIAFEQKNIFVLHSIGMSLLLFASFKRTFKFDLCCLAVAAEKAHNSLINGVEHFDKATMKHAETEEKNPLPPIEGNVCC